MKTRHTVSRRNFMKAGIAAGLALPLLRDHSVADTLPEPTWQKLPKWRGFNLLEKFMVPWSNGPFQETDFQMISELGFNFVRLPMDYRTWIVDKDWRKFDEKVLKEIDDAVQFGEKYGIHVNMNFHRAPGYTVANPPESPSVWEDAETQDVCALHWATFARRYKQFGNAQVSFNLFNEPQTVEPATYLAVHKKIIDAIRSEDSNRLIICDGTEYGSKPFLPLTDLKVAQATRGYAPSEISHYKANWVNSENFPEPQWPMISINGLLPSPGKTELPEESRKPLTLNFKDDYLQTKLRLRVGTVSSKSKLVVQADGKTVFEHQFDPGPGEGEWEKSVYQEQWKTYQNVYNRDYEAIIPTGTKVVTIQTTEGDWISLSEIGLSAEIFPDREIKIPTTTGWGQKSEVLQFGETRRTPNLSYPLATMTGGTVRDKNWLKETMIAPWQELERAGSGVMVGEFGCFNHTPHDVVLRWLGDSIANWNEAGWGYAMWNFRGSFGILDSDRTDVDYEDFHGHKLDRKLLELMRQV